MKKINYFLSFAVLAFLFASAGCDGGDDGGAPAPDVVGGNFTGTWTAQSVSFGSPAEDRSADYSDFSLTVTYTAGENGGGMSISGGPADLRPFAQSDTWTYAGTIDNANVTSFSVTRASDGLTINVSDFSANTATLTFTLGPGGSVSRTEAVEGSWTFVMTK